MTVEGIIFDCDGVLVDSERLSAQVLHEYLIELGLKLTLEQVDSFYRGRSLKDVELDITQRLGRETIVDFQQQVAQRTRLAFDDSLQAIDGVTELLIALQREGYPMAVASSGTPEKIAHSLALTGLSSFFGPHVYSATQVEAGKPAPDLFVFAAKELGLQPTSCAVIEDSAAGVRGAVAAGCLTIGYCAETNAIELARHGARTVTQMSEIPLLLKAQKLHSTGTQRIRAGN